MATVHDSYNSVVELGSSSSSISTTVVQARNVSCRVNVLMETQKRQRGDSFATIGGGGKGPFRGTVFVFLKLVRSVDTKCREVFVVNNFDACFHMVETTVATVSYTVAS
jgi:hypothetical protein